jgi:hypothetical protein
MLSFEHSSLLDIERNHDRLKNAILRTAAQDEGQQLFERRAAALPGQGIESR